jgi:hypothetical protein
MENTRIVPDTNSFKRSASTLYHNIFSHMTLSGSEKLFTVWLNNSLIIVVPIRNQTFENRTAALLAAPFF